MHRSSFMYVAKNKRSSIGKNNFNTRVLKNTYPVRTEHALQFRVLTARAAGSQTVAGVLHCMRQSAYMHRI